MARLPFVDTHVHFFDLDDPSLRYSWLERETPWNPSQPAMKSHSIS